MSIVAIVGRPNVGKSTLFNRLIERKDAIVSEVCGTTRDRNYGECIWNGFTFTLIDTGGFCDDCKIDKISGEINNQINIAIEEANIILFVVDAHDGITDTDKIFADVLRKRCGTKDVLLIVNKTDNSDLEFTSFDFIRLGFKNQINISAINGGGTGDLLDRIIITLEKYKDSNKDENILPRFSILGQPNVGKSSLLNVLTNQNRSIVDDASGTTRDSIDTVYNLYGQKFILIDTAGIRKKSKKKDDIEFYSTLRSIKSLENCDACLYMIDATLGIEKQDLALINLAVKRGKCVLILVNKSDLLDQDALKKLKINISERLKNLNFIPVMFISVLKKKNIFQIIQKIVKIYKNKNKQISTSKLNDILLPIIEKNPPSSIRGREIKIKYITQLKSKNVNIAFFCNSPDDVRENYKQFLEKKIRDSFDLEGIPIKLIFKQK